MHSSWSVDARDRSIPWQMTCSWHCISKLHGWRRRTPLRQQGRDVCRDESGWLEAPRPRGRHAPHPGAIHPSSWRGRQIGPSGKSHLKHEAPRGGGGRSAHVACRAFPWAAIRRGRIRFATHAWGGAISPSWLQGSHRDSLPTLGGARPLAGAFPRHRQVACRPQHHRLRRRGRACRPRMDPRTLEKFMNAVSKLVCAVAPARGSVSARK